MKIMKWKKDAANISNCQPFADIISSAFRKQSSKKLKNKLNSHSNKLSTLPKLSYQYINLSIKYPINSAIYLKLLPFF